MECTDRAVDVHSWGRCERRRVGAVVGTWARFEARGRAWDRRWRGVPYSAMYWCAVERLRTYLGGDEVGRRGERARDDWFGSIS